MFGSRTSWSSGWLSGSRKICISFGNLEDENGKTESWRNTYRGVDLKKMRFVRGDSLVPIHQLPVPGGKLWMGTIETLLIYRNIIFELVVSSQPWCDPLFETQSTTHWFSQHLLVRPIIFNSTSNSIKTRLIKWKQGLGIHCWISKLCFLISRNY